jgi:hypothetical protein
MIDVTGQFGVNSGNTGILTDPGRSEFDDFGNRLGPMTGTLAAGAAILGLTSQSGGFGRTRAGFPLQPGFDHFGYLGDEMVHLLLIHVGFSMNNERCLFCPPQASHPGKKVLIIGAGDDKVKGKKP